MRLVGNNGGRRALMLVLGAVLAGLALLVLLSLPSAESRAANQFEIESDIAYGPPNDQPDSNLLDVYVPKDRSARPRPVFVWIHGGGWFRGDKMSPTMEYKAKSLIRAGFIFVSVNYRLSPDLSGPHAMSPGRVRFPVPHRDAARAIGWVDRNIARYGGNPRRIVIGGDSAGGQIAALLATRPAFLKARGVSTRQIRGVLSLDAVGFNVPRMMTRAYRRISAGFQRMMLNAFGTRAEERDRPQWRAASPIRFADPSDPPTFFVVPESSRDRWRDAHRMARLLEQDLDFVSWRVDTNHPGVVPLLGNPRGDMGLTPRALRFVKAAVEPARLRVVIRGRRVVRSTGDGRTPVSLTIRSRPEARRVTCQIDDLRETRCPREWNLRPGLHRLWVRAYSDTGRATTRSVRIRVPR